MARRKIELLFSVIVALFLLGALWEARHWPASSKLFPWSVGFAVLTLALMQVGVAWRAAIRKNKARPVVEKTLKDADVNAAAEFSPVIPEKSPKTEEVTRRRLVTILVWIGIFFIGIWLLGFKIGSLCLSFLFLKSTANEGWIISTTIAVGTYLFFWLIFDVALGVPLGNGLIAEYFGFN